MNKCVQLLFFLNKETDQYWWEIIEIKKAIPGCQSKLKISNSELSKERNTISLKYTTK